jgi:GntR family transcriptional regulator, transcriptional repressor for pyruvate dehydrogenase complex
MRPPLRPPRLAEMVAAMLRQRILSGVLAGGDRLPKQADLLAEFGVSRPSLREALRILETEGLVTVQRGHLGGATVHAPKTDDTAYMLGLVLQGKQVELDDVGVALRHMEPACAALCADLEDRGEVVAALRQVQRDTVAAVGDDIRFVDHARRFHEQLVALCGNETMKVVVGALESVWSVHERAWARTASGAGSFPHPDLRRQGIDAHARILSMVEQGDPRRVMDVAYRHLQRSQIYALGDRGAARVEAARLRHVDGLARRTIHHGDI